ncbi:hypothetical protein CASFOL_002433 [Castilleja foliolosa]|uniref:NAB domain-containing protein n=1 Tax=Castilleja foliolosa TaxID=1961234 RepID=A0ABD3EEK9_9LAMI
MTKHQWKSMSNHIDPEKEEQLKWVKIGKKIEPLQQSHWRIWDSALKPKRTVFKACLPAHCYPERGYLWYTEWQLIRSKLRILYIDLSIENQVKKVVKITKNLNHGNKERNLRNKSEVINIVEDFEKQYKSLYSLYEDLREQVKKNVNSGDVDDNSNTSSSTSNSDSESYYSPGGSYARSTQNSNSTSKGSDSGNEPDRTSDLEDTILKDKLTCSSEVKQITDLDSQVQEAKKVGPETDQVKDLEIESLRLEISTLCMEKGELKEQVSRLEAQVSEFDAKSKENERRFYSVKQLEDIEQKYISRVSELVAQAKDMQIELDALRNQKSDLEGRFMIETEKSSSRVKELIEQVNFLKNELANVNSQKNELKWEIENKSKEMSNCMIEIENLKNELANVNSQKNELKAEIENKSKETSNCMIEIEILKNELASVNSQKNELNSEIENKSKETSNCMIEIENLKNELRSSEQRLSKEKESVKAQANDLESKIHSLLVEKTELEERVKKLNDEASQSNVKISELRKDNENERKKFTDFENLMSTKTKSLAEEVNNLNNELGVIENEKTRYKKEIEALRGDKKRLQKELEQSKGESFLTKSQLEKFSKSNFQAVEKKVEDMLEEFRKKLEDQYRILSRRIRVAEQLQVENKEWYRKTKEAYEQQNNDLKIRAERNEIELKNVKDMTLAANDVLTSLDSVALSFEENSANFLNRISKASCELKFAKHWAMRKNKANMHVKDEMDCLLAQLDDKEVEILVFREKVWKSDNKVRELEKMVKEKDDAMMGLKEEKREAIRQLCVWIDHHRGRSDYYMKMLSEMNPTRKRMS